MHLEGVHLSYDEACWMWMTISLYLQALIDTYTAAFPNLFLPYLSRNSVRQLTQTREFTRILDKND